MLHSLSPHGRRLVEEMYTGDPYDVNIKIDNKARNRSAEILNARLKTMGYRMNFRKTRKNIVNASFIPAVTFGNGPDGLVDAVKFVGEGYDYDHWYKTMREIEDEKKKLPMSLPAVIFH